MMADMESPKTELGLAPALARNANCWVFRASNIVSSLRGAEKYRYISWNAVSTSCGDADPLIPSESEPTEGETRTALPASFFPSAV